VDALITGDGYDRYEPTLYAILPSLIRGASDDKFEMSARQLRDEACLLPFETFGRNALASDPFWKKVRHFAADHMVKKNIRFGAPKEPFVLIAGVGDAALE
jgi:hypothetical protein